MRQALKISPFNLMEEKIANGLPFPQPQPGPQAIKDSAEVNVKANTILKREYGSGKQPI